MESESQEQTSLNEEQQECAENGLTNSPSSSSLSRPSSSRARKPVRKRKPLEISKKNGGLCPKFGRSNSGAVKGRKTVSAAKSPKKLSEVDKPAEDSAKGSADCPHNSSPNDGEDPNAGKVNTVGDETPAPVLSKAGKRKLPEENSPNLPSEGAKETESGNCRSSQLRPWRCGMRKSKRKVAEAEMAQNSPIKQKMCLDPERARKVQEYMEAKQRERRKERQRKEAEAKAALQARQEKAKALELQRRDRLRAEAARRSKKASLKRPAWDSDFSVFPNANFGPWTTAPEAEVGFPPPKPQATEYVGSGYGGCEGLQFQAPRKGQFQPSALTQCQPRWTHTSDICLDSENQDLSSFPYPKGYVKKTPVHKPSNIHECSDQRKPRKCKPQSRRVLATPTKSPSRASISKSILSSQKAHSRTLSSIGKYQRVSPRTLKRVVTTSPFLRSSLEKAYSRASNSIRKYQRISPRTLKRVVSRSPLLRSSLEKMKLERPKRRVSHKEVPRTSKALRVNDSHVSHKLGRVVSIRSGLKGHSWVSRASSVQSPKKSSQVKGKIYSKASSKRLGGAEYKNSQAISEGGRLKSQLMGFARQNTVRIGFPGFGKQSGLQMPINNKEIAPLIPQNRLHMEKEAISLENENCGSNEVKDERKVTDAVNSQRTSLLKTIAQQLAGHLNAAANIAKWKNNALYSPKGSNGACYEKTSDGSEVMKNMEDNQLRSISVAELRQLLQKKCNPARDLEMRDTPDGVSVWKGLNSVADWKKSIISSDEELQRRGDTLSSSLQSTQQILTLNESSSCGITLHDIRSNKLPLPLEGEKLSVINLYLKHQHSKQAGETILAKDLQLVGSDGKFKRLSGAQDPWLHSSDNQTFAFPEIQGSCGLLLDSIQSPQNQSDRAFLDKKGSESTTLSIKNNYVDSRSARKLVEKDSLSEQSSMRLQRGKRMKKYKKGKRKQDIRQMQKLPENLTTAKTKRQAISEDSGYHCSSDSSREGGVRQKLIRKDWLEKYARRRCREGCDGKSKWNMNALKEELQRLDNEIVQTKARMERNPLFIHMALPNDFNSSHAIQRHMSVVTKSDCRTPDHAVEKENTIPLYPSSCAPKRFSPCSNATSKMLVSSEVLQNSDATNLQKDLSTNEAVLEDLMHEMIPRVQINSDSVIIASEESTDVQSNSGSGQHDDGWNNRKCGLTGAKFNSLGAGVRYSSDDFNGAVSEGNSHACEGCEELSKALEVTRELNNALPTDPPCHKVDNFLIPKSNVRKVLTDSSCDINASVSENNSHIARVNEEQRITAEGGSEFDDAIPTHSPCQKSDSFLATEHCRAKFESFKAGLRDSLKELNGTISEEISHSFVVDENLKKVPEVTNELNVVLTTHSPRQQDGNFFSSVHDTVVCFTQGQESNKTSGNDEKHSEICETEEDISEDIICNGEEDRNEHNEEKNLPQIREKCQLGVMIGGHVKKLELNELSAESCLPMDVQLDDSAVNYADETNNFEHMTVDLQEAKSEHACELLCNIEEEHDIFSLDAIAVGTVQGKGETSLENNFFITDPLAECHQSVTQVQESGQDRDCSKKESNQESALNEYLSRHSHIDSEHHSLESWFEDSALELSWGVCKQRKDIGSHVSNTQVESMKESRCVINAFGKEECEKAVDIITDKLLENILEDELSDFTSLTQSSPSHKLQLKVAVKGLSDLAESNFRSREESECKDLPRKIATNLIRFREILPLSKDSGPFENHSSSPATKFIFTSKSMSKYSSYISHYLSDRGTPVTNFSDDNSEGEISQKFVQSYVSKVLEASGLLKVPSSLIWLDDEMTIPSDLYPVAGKSIPRVTDKHEINGGTETKLLFDAVNESLQRHSLKASALVLEFSRPLLNGEEAVQAVANDIFKNMNMDCKTGLDLEFLLEKSVDEDWNNHSREILYTCSQIAEALLGDLVGGLVNELEDDCKISQLGGTGIEVF